MDWAELLRGSGVIVDLPEAEPDDLIAAGEVLLQEGLFTWAVPLARLAELDGLRAVFGSRAALAVTGLRTPEQVAAAAGAGAELLLSPLADGSLLAAAGGVPLVLGGLTPTEVARALELKPAGVQVIPCDAMGSLYARSLTELFPGAGLMATGRLERFQCEMWLDAGAGAVHPVGAITEAEVAEPDLSPLRRRCREFRFGG